MRKIFILFSIIAFGQVAKAGPAENMSTFLSSCAYGTLGGAALGLATLAWSENPNGKINNVARGASLGLYAGIAYGAYLVNNPNKSNSIDMTYDPSESLKPKELVWVSPLIQEKHLDGVQLNLSGFRF